MEGRTAVAVASWGLIYEFGQLGRPEIHANAASSVRVQERTMELFHSRDALHRKSDMCDTLLGK